MSGLFAAAAIGLAPSAVAGTGSVVTASTGAGSVATASTGMVTGTQRLPVSLTTSESASPLSAPPATGWESTDRIIDDLTPARPRARLRLLVIPVYWSGNDKDRTSRSALRRAVLTRTDKALRAVSSGRIGVRGTVTPWVKVSAKTTCRRYGDLARKAVAAAERRSSAYRASRYDRVVLYLPQDDCQWSGLAQLGQRRTDGTTRAGRVIWLNGATSAVVVTHELGHTFGLQHANAIECDGTRAILRSLARCSGTEYGDLADLMASSDHQGVANAAYLRQVNWLTRKQVKRASGRTTKVTLVPLASSARGRKAIRIDTANRTYWVEYRTRTGLDGALTADLTGVIVHLELRSRVTYALDMQPQNSTAAIALPVGASWTSPEGTRITVAAQTGSRARVIVVKRAGAASRPAEPGAPQVLADGDVALVTVSKGADRGSPIQSWAVTATPVEGGAPVRSTVLATAARSATGRLAGLVPGLAYTVTAVAYNEKGRSPQSRPSLPVTLTASAPPGGPAGPGALSTSERPTH